MEFTGRALEQLSNEIRRLDSVHPEDVDRCLQTYVSAFEARTPFLMEYRVRHADGGYRWSHGVVMRCGAEGDFASMAPEAGLCVYRAAQEALRNVVARWRQPRGLSRRWRD